MDNQHKLIRGYRDLNPSEIDLMNEVKSLGERVGHLVDEINKNPTVDGRWVAIGQTQLQQGFMALVRAVAQPTSF